MAAARAAARAAAARVVARAVEGKVVAARAVERVAGDDDVARARRGHGARRVFAAEDEDLALVGRQRRRVRLALAVHSEQRRPLPLLLVLVVAERLRAEELLGYLRLVAVLLRRLLRVFSVLRFIVVAHAAPQSACQTQKRGRKCS